MPVDPDLPIPLILGQLKDNTAWQFIQERLAEHRNLYIKRLLGMPGDAPAAELQRLLGYIEGIGRVLEEPAQIQKEWERARATSPAHSRTAARAT